jgi:hypothetical protein
MIVDRDGNGCCCFRLGQHKSGAVFQERLAGENFDPNLRSFSGETELIAAIQQSIRHQ